jgi:hypothetical protein
MYKNVLIDGNFCTARKTFPTSFRTTQATRARRPNSTAFPQVSRFPKSDASMQRNGASAATPLRFAPECLHYFNPEELDNIQVVNPICQHDSPGPAPLPEPRRIINDQYW